MQAIGRFWIARRPAQKSSDARLTGMSNGEVGIWELISRKLAADLPTGSRALAARPYYALPDLARSRHTNLARRAGIGFADRQNESGLQGESAVVFKIDCSLVFADINDTRC